VGIYKAGHYDFVSSVEGILRTVRRIDLLADLGDVVVLYKNLASGIDASCFVHSSDEGVLNVDTRHEFHLSCVYVRACF